MVVVHNRDPTKNYVNTLIEHTPKPSLKLPMLLKKMPRSSINTPNTITIDNRDYV